MISSSFILKLKLRPEGTGDIIKKEDSERNKKEHVF